MIREILLATAILSVSLPAAAAVRNVRDFGAKGDGRTHDTAAIQAAIDQSAAGDIVLLPRGGTFLAGTIRLKSDLVFRIEAGARLLGSRDDRDYPDLTPPTVNSQLHNCRKSLLYAEGVKNLVIEGDADAGVPADLRATGMIDGNGANNDAWNGPELSRPMAIFIALSSHVTLRHLQVVNAGMWTVVPFEDEDVLIDSLRVESTSGPTRDGIDIVDCSRVVVRNVDVNSEDDAICLKSGSAKGLHDVLVQDSIVRGSGVANALKFGTASVGPIENIRFENIRIDSVKQAAMAIESVDGSAISGLSFKHIRFRNAGTAFFILLGGRKGSPGIGSIRDVSFEDIEGETILNWGSAITGSRIGEETHALQGLRFANIRIQSKGGLKNTPSAPLEYAGQYPDPRMWGPLPAFGLYFRHVEGLTLDTTDVQGAPGDPRSAIVKDDAR